MKDIKVTFGEGLQVNAEYKGFIIETDQPVHQGGDGKAPAPFDLFLSSIATCAGFYVLAFCRERKISVDAIQVVMSMRKGEGSKRIGEITITIDLPGDFPEKYTQALIRAVDLCTVKVHILNPPQFKILTRPGA